MQRVLDTAALLTFPMNELNGALCVERQRDELEKLSPQRSMLVESADIEWLQPTQAWVAQARTAASQSGDLPQLSPVDLDLLALAIGCEAVLFTDDYRMQNVLSGLTLPWKPVSNAPSKAVWKWVLKCIGCRKTHPIPENIQLKRDEYHGECPHCGSPCQLKRARS